MAAAVPQTPFRCLHHQIGWMMGSWPGTTACSAAPRLQNNPMAAVAMHLRAGSMASTQCGSGSGMQTNDTVILIIMALRGMEMGRGIKSQQTGLPNLVGPFLTRDGIRTREAQVPLVADGGRSVKQGALSSTVVGTMLAVTYERLFGKQSSKSKAAWAARVQKQHASLSRTSLFQLPHSNDQMYNNDRSAFRTAILTRGMHRGCKPLRAVDA